LADMELKKKNIPKQITPSPIVEAVVEARYDTDYPEEVIPGIIYNELKSRFPKPVEKLPVANLPAEVKNRDPNLQFAPHYRFPGENLSVQVGPKVFSLLNHPKYMGWEKYSEEIRFAFDVLKKSSIVKKPRRLGVRYINFFEFDIFDKLEASLTLAGNSIAGNQSFLRTEFAIGDYRCVLQIANGTTIQAGGASKKGSVVDIDLSRERPFSWDELRDLINDAHDLEKQLFFNLLKDDYLKTLSPIYP